MKERTLQIDFIGSSAPVLGRGTINGFPFSFYARWDGWTFSVALHPDVDVDLIAWSDKNGFYMEGDYGEPGGYSASVMPEQEAERLIRKCAQFFFEYMESNPASDA